MAGFRKAKAEQAALKMGFYGSPGSGKTFTALLVAEGLAKATGKRVAYCDTERGTDFYAKEVADRRIHPQAFDFDALYSRSLTEVTREVKSLKPDQYGVIVIDSITHLWEAARLAYEGKTTSVGSIPMHAWGKIKAPYKELVNFLLNCPQHVIICGREGNEFENDEETGQLKKVGTKMKAEGETPYEPHILLRFECQRSKGGEGLIQCFAEKDRTGLLAGKVIQWPDYAKLAEPIMRLLGGVQAHIPSDDETGKEDAERLTDQDEERHRVSLEWLEMIAAKLTLAETDDQVEKVAKEMTPEVKKAMLAMHVSQIRDKYLEAKKRTAHTVKSAVPAKRKDNGKLFEEQTATV